MQDLEPVTVKQITRPDGSLAWRASRGGRSAIHQQRWQAEVMLQILLASNPDPPER
jgi:hypothetical protein